MHMVKAKRKEEELGSYAAEKRQEVMTESQLAMLQAQFFAAENEKIQNMADAETKRQAEVREQRERLLPLC